MSLAMTSVHEVKDFDGPCNAIRSKLAANLDASVFVEEDEEHKFGYSGDTHFVLGFGQCIQHN